MLQLMGGRQTVTGMWEITPKKSARVNECVRCFWYVVSSECHVMNRASRK